MAGGDGEVLARAVTTYLLNTTELRPRPSLHRVLSILNGAVMVCGGAKHRLGVDAIPLSTGSVAELCIEPLARCFGDYDTMYHYNDMLAIPTGCPPPHHLPDYFDDEVNLYEMRDSHIPGYVYLVLRYQLRRHEKTYAASRYDEEDEAAGYTFLLQSNRDDLKSHGPATVNPIASWSNVITGREDEPDTFAMSLDWVYSVRCLHWPIQAANWPARPRPHGYPDPATVQRVVADGCDLVPVTHRLCRDDPSVSDRQWRLSFSRAELALINCWTPRQQIVYHVLRTVLKLADITNDDDVTVVSNYHIKTLMLWATELHRAAMWNTGDHCIISASARLLDTLACWLQQRHCSHYFLDEANLFLLTKDQCQYVDRVLSKLWSIADINVLARLLLDKYVRPCVLQVCPTDIARMMHDDRLIEEAVAVVATWRQGELREKSWRTLDTCLHSIERFIYEMSLTAQACCYLVDSLELVERRLVPHFIGAACLHVAYRLATRHPYRLRHRDQLLDVIAVIFSSPSVRQTFRQRNTSVAKTGVLLRTAAQSSLRKGSKDRSIQMELCKAYLHSELTSDADSQTFYLAQVHLAALYFDEERYEFAMHHCGLADTSSCTSYVQAEQLPSIDEISVATGLSALYEFVRHSSTWTSRERYLGVLTSNLVASFFQLECVSHSHSRTVHSTLAGELVRYRSRLLSCPHPLLGDVLLFKLTTSKLRMTSTSATSLAENSGQRDAAAGTATWNNSELVRLLTETAVERLTQFREMQMEEFGSDIVAETTDFLAVDAFRVRHYTRCMRLCQQNIEDLADCAVMQEIFVMPEFIYLLGDCDLVSMVGLTLLVCPEIRARVEYQFGFRLSQLALSLYLYTESQLRLRHSAASLEETLLCATLASRRHPPQAVLNSWTFQLINQKLIHCIENHV